MPAASSKHHAQRYVQVSYNLYYYCKQPDGVPPSPGSCLCFIAAAIITCDCGAGGTGRCEVSDCSITRNKLNGVLVKDGGELVADNNDITGNGSHGIQLSYCSADLHQNRLSGNKQGSVALELGTVSADAQEIQEQNSLSEDVVLL